jgi:hypothetical protein
MLGTAVSYTVVTHSRYECGLEQQCSMQQQQQQQQQLLLLVVVVGLAAVLQLASPAVSVCSGWRCWQRRWGLVVPQDVIFLNSSCTLMALLPQ